MGDSRVGQLGDSMVEDMARILWYEAGHRKPWSQVAEATKERFRRPALEELSHVFCDA